MPGPIGSRLSEGCLEGLPLDSWRVGLLQGSGKVVRGQRLVASCGIGLCWWYWGSKQARVGVADGREAGVEEVRVNTRLVCQG